MSFSSNPTPFRAPRLRAIINDTTIIAPYSAEITHTASYGAATFALSISLSDTPGLDAAYWAALARLYVKIQIASDRTLPFIDLVEGYCDAIQLHPISGFVQIEGRDLSASLLDKKTSSNFQNQTSSEIARTLADVHNLNAVITDTSRFAGRYYATDSNMTSLSQYAKLSSDWDILVALAQAENYDLYVSGTTLYFQPTASIIGAPQSVPYSSLIDLRMNRALALATGIAVTVQSWDSATATAVSETCNPSAFQNSGKSGATSGAQWLTIRPNLSSDTAGVLAQQIADSMYGKSMSLDLTMPGDSTMDVRQPVELYGSNTSFDQIYEIDSIMRSFRSNSGFIQTIRARLQPQAGK